MENAETENKADETPPPEARLRVALKRLGEELAALPEPDSPDMKDAAVLRAEADVLREETAGLRESLAEAEAMVQALSRAGEGTQTDEMMAAFPSTARLAAAAAESLEEAEKEAQSLREALRMLDHSYQILKQSHEEAVAALAKSVPEPDAEIVAMRAARAAEAAELEILRGRLAALIADPEGEPNQ